MNVDRLVDQKKHLEEEVKSLTAELALKSQDILKLNISTAKKVATVEAEKGILQKEYEKRFLAWHTETTKQKRLEAEVAELELQLNEAMKLVESSRCEAAAVKDQLAKSKELLQTRDRDLQKINENHEKTDRELAGALSKFKSLQQDQKALGLTELSPEAL